MAAAGLRVLLEHENPRIVDAQAEELVAAGFTVDVCPGPGGRGGPGCPLVEGQGCDKVAAADVIVNELPLGRLAVCVALSRCYPDRPIVVALSAGERARLPIFEQLFKVIPRRITPQELVDEVHAAARG